MQSWPSWATTITVVGVLLVAVVAAILLFVLRRRRKPAAIEERRALAAAPPARLRTALTKTGESVRQRLAEVFGRDREREVILASLEEVLLGADVGVPTTTRILQAVRERCAKEPAPAEATVREALRAAIEQALGDETPKARTAKPWVILVSGVNGVGKTTSIGKLAARFRADGEKVLVVAADTFRAAAIDQLSIWAGRAGAEVVRHQSGADPAAVAFDGMKAAIARGVDVVLVDTAGRLHTRENLMEELRKVSRVIGKAVPEAPHEVWLVLDATTGRNAVQQAKVFSEALGLTGIVLTKLDGTAKGGAVLAVRQEMGLPILYVGVGEGIDDLRPFSASEFAAGLLGEE
jgi:fused signal recognition particle receptor